MNYTNDPDRVANSVDCQCLLESVGLANVVGIQKLEIFLDKTEEVRIKVQRVSASNDPTAIFQTYALKGDEIWWLLDALNITRPVVSVLITLKAGSLITIDTRREMRQNELERLAAALKGLPLTNMEEL